MGLSLQKVEYTLGEEPEAPGQRQLAPEELSRQLEKLLKEGSSNQRVLDWIEANLSEQQVASNTLVRALMTTVCYSAILCKGPSMAGGGALSVPAEGTPAYPVFPPTVETPLKIDVSVLKMRAKLLQKYLCDEQKELQALYALQALVVTLEQPASKDRAGGSQGRGRRGSGVVTGDAQCPGRCSPSPLLRDCREQEGDGC